MITKNFIIVTVVNNTPASYKALDYTLKLCSTMQKDSYVLKIAYIVGLNPPQGLPYL